MPSRPKYATEEERREARRVSSREWARRNQAHNREASAKWAKEHPEQHRATARRHYHAHPTAERARSLFYANTHKAERREYARRRRHELRLRVIAAYGGECCRCGFDDWRALQIDHVSGGGWAERVAAGQQRPVPYHKHLLQEVQSGRYQLLCANCNWIKRYEQEEHSNIISRDLE